MMQPLTRAKAIVWRITCNLRPAADKLQTFFRNRCWRKGNRYRKILNSIFIRGILIFLSNGSASAGPPFLTDDPEPVPYRHYEFYSFSTMDKAADGTTVQIPAVEFNMGAARNFQIHFVAPLVSAVPGSGSVAYGPGDMEFGAKYCFMDEKGARPQVGIFPMIELPTGDAVRHLGNGTLWARFPLWLQKSGGHWTTSGGAGYEINRAPEIKDSAFAGWLLQRDFGRKLTLGGEIYVQTAQASAGRNSSYLDAGGYYYFNPNFQLLFMMGHTIAGESHTIGYWGLYWTW